MKIIAKILKNTKGATAIEYGLVAALVAVGAATAFGELGTEVGTTFGDVENELAAAA